MGEVSLKTKWLNPIWKFFAPRSGLQFMWSYPKSSTAGIFLNVNCLFVQVRKSHAFANRLQSFSTTHIENWKQWCINTLIPEQIERHFGEDFFQSNFVKENVIIVLWLKFDWFFPQGHTSHYVNIAAAKGLASNKRQAITWANVDHALIQLTSCGVTEPQWVKPLDFRKLHNPRLRQLGLGLKEIHYESNRNTVIHFWERRINLSSVLSRHGSGVNCSNMITPNPEHVPVYQSWWRHQMETFPRNWPFVRGIHRSRWIPHTKASDAEFWCFLWSASE